VTENQRATLEHALGLDYPWKIRDGVTWRNHYCASDRDEDCEALVAAGLMERGHTINGGRDRYYFATRAGMDLVGIREVSK
jgi:hypothetical protein